MWSLSNWLKTKDEAVLDMQQPLLSSDGAGSYVPPPLPPHCPDRLGSRALSDQLPISDRLPISAQRSGHLISYSCPATPDTSCSGHGDPSSRVQGLRSTELQNPYQHASPQPVRDKGFSDPSQAFASAGLTIATQATAGSDSEEEIRHARGTRNRSFRDDGIERQSSWRRTVQPEPSGQHNTSERQLSHEHSGYCQRCRSGSLDRGPSSDVIWARRPPSRHTQDSMAGRLAQNSCLMKTQLLALPPSPFSILHQSQRELLRSPSSVDEEHGYDDALRRPSSTFRESASAANSRRSSMLSRLGSNQAAQPDQAMESMHSAALPGSYSWVPVMHADTQGCGTIPSNLHNASLQRARDAVRLWHGALKWVALWLTLSILTLLHAFGLVHSMANVALAKVCAGLFCWTGVLGLIGSIKGLISECLAQQRSDNIAAANALGLKSVSIIAFMSAVLSCLACLVHAFVLNLLFQQNPHLPPCDPNIPLCVETYNLLLVLMVATMAMYGAHGTVSAVVAHRAHSARQILRNGSTLQT